MRGWRSGVVEAGVRFDEWVILLEGIYFLAIRRGPEAARVKVLCLSPMALDTEGLALNTMLFGDPFNALWLRWLKT